MKVWFLYLFLNYLITISILLILYDDGMLIIAKISQRFEKLNHMLTIEFDMKDLKATKENFWH